MLSIINLFGYNNNSIYWVSNVFTFELIIRPNYKRWKCRARCYCRREMWYTKATTNYPFSKHCSSISLRRIDCRLTNPTHMQRIHRNNYFNSKCKITHRRYNLLCRRRHRHQIIRERTKNNSGYVVVVRVSCCVQPFENMIWRRDCRCDFSLRVCLVCSWKNWCQADQMYDIIYSNYLEN